MNKCKKKLYAIVRATCCRATCCRGVNAALVHHCSMLRFSRLWIHTVGTGRLRSPSLSVAVSVTVWSTAWSEFMRSTPMPLWTCGGCTRPSQLRLQTSFRQDIETSCLNDLVARAFASAGIPGFPVTFQR